MTSILYIIAVIVVAYCVTKLAADYKRFKKDAEARERESEEFWRRYGADK